MKRIFFLVLISCFFCMCSMQAFAANEIVAVGDVGTIVTSSDGVTWTVQSSSTSWRLWGVAWNGRLWVVVGENGTILTSTDGIDWNLQTSPSDENLWSVAWNGKMWLALGYKGTVLTSPNGTDWYLQPKIPTKTGFLSQVVWNGYVWIAAGDNGEIFSSLDGKAWTPRECKTNANSWGIGCGNGVCIAVLTDGNMAMSSDVAHWTLHKIGDNGCLGVAWNKFWVAVGGDGSIYTSVDAIKWQKQISGVTKPILTKVAWNGSIWVAVGTDGAIVASSNGVNWAVQYSGTTVNLNGVA